MKRKMKYEELYAHCYNMAEKLKNKEFDEIIAVSRGGLTAAHILGKMLKLEVGIFNTKTEEILTINEHATKFLIVEDLVAQGRTLKIIEEAFSPFRWEFYATVIDSSYTNYKYHYSLITDEWIVFPYEDFDAVKENDRGLFRFKTDSYGELKCLT